MLFSPHWAIRFLTIEFNAARDDDDFFFFLLLFSFKLFTHFFFFVLKKFFGFSSTFASVESSLLQSFMLLRISNTLLLLHGKLSLTRENSWLQYIFSFSLQFLLKKSSSSSEPVIWNLFSPFVLILCSIFNYKAFQRSFNFIYTDAS